MTDLAAHQSDQAWVLESEEDSSVFYPIKKDRLVLGALASADVRLLSSDVAPLHAIIERSESNFYIYDLGSETGIKINGKKTVSEKLKENDLIEIGSNQFRFLRKKNNEPPSEDISALLLEDIKPSLFDYKSTLKPSLEVVLSWRATILDVLHFVVSKKITIGSKAHFIIPPLLGVKTFTLLTRTNKGAELHLRPQMKGLLQQKGKLFSISDLVKMKKTKIFLDEKDFAKVELGELTFYIHSAKAPPLLKRRWLTEPDRVFWKIFGSSLALTLFIIVTLLNLKLNKSIIPLEPPQRLATILYQPEKYSSFQPQEDKLDEPSQPPTQVVKRSQKTSSISDPSKVDVKEKRVRGFETAQKATLQGQKEAQEGVGMRAQGKEGSRGLPTAPKTAEPQYQASRLSPQPQKGRGAGQSEVAQNGNIDLLKGASSQIQNLLGNAALKGRGSELKGYGGFTTRGQGGLALSGEGSGGGGNAIALGGLSPDQVGHGGGRVGTGLGASGTGSGIIGGKSRIAIQLGGPEEALVMGSIDFDALEAAILARKDEFRLCYEREINANQFELSGKVVPHFMIGPSGRITEAGIQNSTIKNAQVEACVLEVLKRIQFPMPRGGGAVEVSYGFSFSPVRGGNP